jgi:hypothetical protein
MLAAFNAAFVVAILGGWAIISGILADPLSWATVTSVPRGTPNYLEYPFIVMWVVPAIGLCLAWVAHKGEYSRLAVAILLVPVLFLAVTLGWFHFAPSDLR